MITKLPFEISSHSHDIFVYKRRYGINSIVCISIVSYSLNYTTINFLFLVYQVQQVFLNNHLKNFKYPI